MTKFRKIRGPHLWELPAGDPCIILFPITMHRMNSLLSLTTPSLGLRIPSIGFRDPGLLATRAQPATIYHQHGRSQDLG